MTGVRAALLLLSCLPAMAGAALEPLEPYERLEQQTRRVYVLAVDKSRVPVADLTAADVTVKENGKERAIVNVAPATGVLQIAILVDDNGTGLFRVGVGRFVEAMFKRAEFSISTVTGQMLKLVDYTSNAQPLAEAIAQLNARPATNDGGQLLDGISETALELTRREARRPVIVALTVGGEEHSTLPAHHVLDNLRKSGASLHVLSVVNKTLRSQPAATSAAGLLGENMNLSEVLGDGPKQSGGVRDEIIAASTVLTGLQHLAEALKRQYIIEYTLPDGVKPSDKLSVSVKRKGVTLYAPTRVPDK